MVVTRAGIAGLIPHEGAMSLLDGVLRWDADFIRCCTRTHTDPGNPLRSHGRLPVLCGIEYAAQAMAVHGGLSGILARRPKLGYLASLRDVHCRVERLDDLAGELVIDADRLAANDLSVMYRFALRVDERLLLEGRAAVLLDASPPPSAGPGAPEDTA